MIKIKDFKVIIEEIKILDEMPYVPEKLEDFFGKYSFFDSNNKYYVLYNGYKENAKKYLNYLTYFNRDTYVIPEEDYIYYTGKEIESSVRSYNCDNPIFSEQVYLVYYGGEKYISNTSSLTNKFYAGAAEDYVIYGNTIKTVNGTIPITIDSIPPLTFTTSINQNLINYRIYGKTENNGSVGDLVTSGEHQGEYVIPVTISKNNQSTTENIYLSSPLSGTKIYGFKFNSNAATASEAITYLEGAVGKTPAAMGANSFSYGDWADAFFMPRPCMLKYDGTVDYYLDPDDYAHKADDGSIPAGYKAVEYLESTGTQYIDTNIGVSSYTDMTVDLMFKAGARTSTSGNVTIFGVRDSLAEAGYSMNYGGSGENKLFFWCGYGASGSFPSITAEYEQLHDVHFEFKNMRVDTTSSTTGPSSPCQTLPADNLRLFGMGGYTSSVYNISTLRIYSFKVTEKVNNVDTVTHNLISAERQSDGELGMYDTVTGDFYTNSGTGTFLKGGYGIASDIERAAYPGNAMMEWPKIWYKFEAGENPGEGYFYVSDTKVDNTYHCWCNYDALDNEIEHFYTAIYNSPTNTTLRSLSGKNLPYWDPYLRSLNERAHANNVNGYVEWQLEVFADRQLIDALIMLIGKSANVTSVFGNGLYGQSGSAQTLLESYTTGTLNDKGLFWGDTSSGNNAVKIFGMENWWGLQSRVVNGILYVIDPAAKLYYKLTYGTADGSETTGYNTSSINQFLSINTNAAMDRDTGYITALTFANGIYYPSWVSSTNNIWNWKFKPYVTYPQASKLFTYGGNIWDSVRSPNGIALHYSGDDDYTFGGNLCCKPVGQSSSNSQTTTNADYIDYSTGKRVDSDGTETNINLPQLSIYNGSNTLTINTQVQPSQVLITYQDGNYIFNNVGDLNLLDKYDIPIILNGTEVQNGIVLNDSLKKVGEVSDYLRYNSNGYNVFYNIKKLVLNGTENWAVDEEKFYINTTFSDCKINSPVYCNKVNSKILEDPNNNDDIWISNEGKLCIIKSDLTLTVEAIKSYLSNNNATIYYQLSVPITDTVTLPALVMEGNARDTMKENTVVIDTETSPSQIKVQNIKKYYTLEELENIINNKME